MIHQNANPQAQASPFWLRCLPLTLLQAYLAGTIVLFLVGPYPWPIDNPIAVVGFLLVVQIALMAGYLSSARKEPLVRQSDETMAKLINVVLIVAAIWAIPAFMIKTVTVRDVYGGPLQTIIAGFTKPGEVYNQHQTVVAMRQAGSIGSLAPGYLTFLDFLLSPVVSLAMPLGIVLWNRLTMGQRALLVFVTTAQVVSWIGIGTNKGLFDLVILFPWLYISQQVRAGTAAGVVLGRVAAFGGSLAILVLAYFVIGGMGRHADRGMNVAEFIDVGDGYRGIFGMMPEGLAFGLLRLCDYLTQGYYALSLALGLDFEPCWGLGNSYWLSSWAKAFTGDVSIIEHSFPGRLQALDINLYTRWHTFYVWIASDVSFFGVPVVVFVIGRMLASAWVDSLWGSDVFAIGLLHLLIIMVVYFPGNNQVLGYAPSGIPFVAFAILRQFGGTLKRK